MLWHLPAEETNQPGCPLTFVRLLFGGLLFGESILLMLRRTWCPEAGSLGVQFLSLYGTGNFQNVSC
jgi:hypothetical protein